MNHRAGNADRKELCRDCTFYREPQRTIEALGSEAPRTPDVLAALQKIGQQQDEQREAEFEYWVEQFYSEPEDATWPRRPTASPYCAADEGTAMAEIRNAGGRCAVDPKPPAQPRSCRTCRHRIPAEGATHDQREFEVRLRLVALGGSSHVETHQKTVDANAALELKTAYFQGGALQAPPQYLDHCGHFRTVRGQYTVCAVENPDNRCPAWSNQ
jgi:hypothetical protein